MPQRLTFTHIFNKNVSDCYVGQPLGAFAPGFRLNSKTIATADPCNSLSEEGFGGCQGTKLFYILSAWIINLYYRDLM